MNIIMDKNSLKRLSVIFVAQIVPLFLFFYSGLYASGEKYVFRTSYECFDLKGNPRWNATTEIFSSPEKGENINTLVETGSGFYSGFSEKISWRSELEYIRETSKIRPFRSTTKTYDSTGKLIAVEAQEFDYVSGNAIFRREDKRSGRVYKEIFKIRQDIVNRLLLGLYIQEFLKSGKDSAFIEILNSEPRLIKCRLYIVDKEDIEVNGIKKTAYKLCLDPQLGLFNFVKTFIPKAYVWHSAVPEFEWLRYNGLEVNLNSPMVEIRKAEDKL
jgi:hypothetical protein